MITATTIPPATTEQAIKLAAFRSQTAELGTETVGLREDRQPRCESCGTPPPLGNYSDCPTCGDPL